MGKHSGGALVRRELRRAGVRAVQDRVRVVVERLKALREARGKAQLRRLVGVKRALDRERAGVSEGEFRRLARWAKRIK